MAKLSKRPSVFSVFSVVNVFASYFTTKKTEVTEITQRTACSSTSRNKSNSRVRGLKVNVCGYLVCSTEWLVNGRALLREKLCAAARNVKAVFQANSKLAIDYDRRFITKAHTSLNRRFVTAHKVCPFMSVQPDAVTGAMWQSGSFVIRAKAGVSDHFASGGVNRFAWRADLCGCETGVLRFAFKVPNVSLPLRRFTEDECARDVGLIAFDAATAIHQHHIAFLQSLRRAAAMRKRGVPPKTAKDSALNTEVAKCRYTVGGKLALWHAVAHRGPGSAISDQGDVVRALHQGDLRGRLEHSTTGSDWRGTDKLELRHLAANAIEEKEAHAFFHADAARANPAIADDLRDAEIRTLILFPGAHVFTEFDQLARPFLFKLGTDPGELTSLWNDKREHALARAPAHAGEIEHAGAWLNVDRVDLLFGHQALRFRDTRLSLVITNGHRARSHATQTLNQIGHFLLPLS